MYKYYNSALFISSGDSYSNQLVSGSINQLSRIQSIGVDVQKPTVNLVYTNLGGQSFAIEKPYINVSFNYLLADGANESYLGLNTNGTGNAIKDLDIEKNLYISFLGGAEEANGANYNNNSTILSIGNAILNSYTLNAQIGGLAVATCEYQGLNAILQTGIPSNKQIPSINKTDYSSYNANYNLPIGQTGQNPIIALGAKDIVLEFPTGAGIFSTLSGSNSIILQSISFNCSINRNNIKEIGKCLRERKMVFPIEYIFNASAFLDKFQISQLNNLICDSVNHDITVHFKKPCSELNSLSLYLKGVKLESENISLGISSTIPVELQWKGYIYNLGTGNGYFGIKKYL